jgi:hypothetical protein
MDYVVKILREVCEANHTELRDAIEGDPEEGVYFVSNYKTHTNDRFTSLAAAKQHDADLKHDWQLEEEARLAALPAPSTERPIDFIIESSYL